jgi:membrane-associated phospholipid phosphatase
VGVLAVGVVTLVASGLVRPPGGARPVLARGVRRLPGAAWRERIAAPWGAGRLPSEEPVSRALGGLAGQWPTFGLGALAAVALAARGGAARALPVAVAAPLAAAAHAAVKYAVRRPRPLTARLTGKHTPSFPSGHAARGAALAGVLAHLASREGLLPAAAALPLAAAYAAAGGASRVWVERHWVSDAVGGWALGSAVAAACALWYDRAAADSSPAEPAVAGSNGRGRTGHGRPRAA